MFIFNNFYIYFMNKLFIFISKMLMNNILNIAFIFTNLFFS